MQPEDSVNNRKMRAFTTCVKALNNLMILFVIVVKTDNSHSHFLVPP